MRPPKAALCSVVLLVTSCGGGNGPASIPFTVGGTVSSPEPSLDLKAVSQGVIKAIGGGALDKTLNKFGLPGFGKPKSQSQPENPEESAPSE